MRHDQPPPGELTQHLPTSHIEAARLVVMTWAHLVLTTPRRTARSTCGPVSMVRSEIDALVDLLGEASAVELGQEHEGTVSLTCPIDGYVVVLLIDVVPGAAS